jgi:hypothetical protein
MIFTIIGSPSISLVLHFVKKGCILRKQQCYNANEKKIGVLAFNVPRFLMTNLTMLRFRLVCRVLKGNQLNGTIPLLNYHYSSYNSVLM